MNTSNEIAITNRIKCRIKTAERKYLYMILCKTIEKSPIPKNILTLFGLLITSVLCTVMEKKRK